MFPVLTGVWLEMADGDNNDQGILAERREGGIVSVFDILDRYTRLLV